MFTIAVIESISRWAHSRCRLTDHVTVRLLAHQSSEGDDGSYAGEEEEDGRRNALRVQSVFEVAQIETVAALNVLNQSAEYSRTFDISLWLRRKPEEQNSTAC